MPKPHSGQRPHSVNAGLSNHSVTASTYDHAREYGLVVTGNIPEMNSPVGGLKMLFLNRKTAHHYGQKEVGKIIRRLLAITKQARHFNAGSEQEEQTPE